MISNPYARACSDKAPVAKRRAGASANHWWLGVCAGVMPIRAVPASVRKSHLRCSAVGPTRIAPAEIHASARQVFCIHACVFESLASSEPLLNRRLDKDEGIQD